MVSDALKGKGVGKILLEKIVELARKRKIKIMPLCPFVKSVFDKTTEYGELYYK